ncbi:transmembrane protein 205 [Diorhabda carinulata]|uniref:transmembrane protein 205 n=1 Tax=Diorhabda carinulata TaxID=1163345 RepID=UPI0025A21706|nr:transmembrane protein 205 [Diorhabda carinulata]
MCVGKIVSELEWTNTGLDDFDFNAVENFSPNTKVPEIPEGTQKDRVDYEQDVLGVSTKYASDLFNAVKRVQQKFYKSNFYKILVYTTQPAHFITAVSVIFIAYLMVPGKAHHKMSPFWNLIYLGSFSAHFGAQIWMTFVSGLALFFSLSRHTFGSVQQVLFPKYFLLNSVLSFITLFVFMKTNNKVLIDTWENFIQAVSISLCFLVELVVRLYFTPPLLRLIGIKHKIEKEAGVGLEVGKYDLGKLRDCPYYLKIHKSFRKIHMTIAILNLVAMACTTLHLYYLSHKLCSI